MFRRLCIVFIALFLTYSTEGKKSKRNKYSEIEEQASPQPDVISYSSFGFEDAGAYDTDPHYMPTSSDHSSLLSSGVNKESATRLYAPAFPTALDATGDGNNYDTQAFDGQSYGVNEFTNLDSNGLQFSQNPFTYWNSQTFSGFDDSHRNIGTVELYNEKSEDKGIPNYGAKIHKNKTKSSKFNYTEDTFSNQESHNNMFNTPSITNAHTINTGHKFNNQGKSPHSHLHKFNSENTATQNTKNPFKFQPVVDFTNLKPHYPLSLDDILTTTSRPSNANAPLPNTYGNGHKNSDINSDSNQLTKTSELNNNYSVNKENSVGDNLMSSNPYINGEISIKHETAPYKNPMKYMDSKKKNKNKPWLLNKHNTTKSSWNQPIPSKGYEYSTNNINMTFKYEHHEPRKPLSTTDEVVSASNNVVDLTNLNFPESQTISHFQRMPEGHFNDFSSISTLSDSQRQPKDFVNPYSGLSTTPQPYWENNYEVTAFPSFNKHPHFGHEVEEFVKIPKPYYHYSTVHEHKPNHWRYGYHNEYKSSIPVKDFNHEELTRFKSEEDLLGLRNQDTSHPSYIPTYKPSGYSSDDDAYFKKVSDRWRQSYLRSKYRDSSYRDVEGLGMDTKIEHVPVPKPYPIEVPHPVIVPVPQPYPVRVPVSKPVAVPVIHELSIPIEKPVPYAVYKKVPYPIEKHVPVTMEKEVAVPVVKPYPIHIPYVRPVFHNSKPSEEEYEYEQDDEEEYVPRPQYSKKNVHYKRKPSNPKTRSRRPSRTAYEDRTRRRWPEHRRPASGEQRYRRPYEEHHATHRYREYDSSDREYYNCKRSGRC